MFGAPVAFEDHAVRGLPCGPGDPEGSMSKYGRDTQYRAIGPTAHQAARLGQIAPPGTLLVSAEPLRLVEGHVRVKAPEAANAPSGQLVYELVSAEPEKNRFQVLASPGLTSFMGRSAEWEQLERLAAKARRGHGQVAAIIGPSAGY